MEESKSNLSNERESVSAKGSGKHEEALKNQGLPHDVQMLINEAIEAEIMKETNLSEALESFRKKYIDFAINKYQDTNGNNKA